jgi:hypothetical protein
MFTEKRVKYYKTLFHSTGCYGESITFPNTFLPLLGRSRDSAVGIATGYGLDDVGVAVRVPVDSRMFSSPLRRDWLWDPSSLLSSGYQELFLGGNATGA